MLDVERQEEGKRRRPPPSLSLHFKLERIWFRRCFVSLVPSLRTDTSLTIELILHGTKPSRSSGSSASSLSPSPSLSRSLSPSLSFLSLSLQDKTLIINASKPKPSPHPHPPPISTPQLPRREPFEGKGQTLSNSRERTSFLPSEGSKGGSRCLGPANEEGKGKEGVMSSGRRERGRGRKRDRKGQDAPEYERCTKRTRPSEGGSR